MPGIYTSWKECEDEIKGYPNAIYKGFIKREDAEVYLDNSDSHQPSERPMDIEGFISKQDASTLIAFVDGSFDSKSKAYGYGAVLINNGEIVHKIMGEDSNQDYIDSRNVAGEIEGVQSAIINAIAFGYSKVAIFYDYEGIEKWATGEWKAAKPISMDYTKFTKEMSKCIEIEYYKVKAHAGIKFNEMADELARKSLLKKGIKNNSNGCVTVTGIDVGEFEIIFELLKDANSEVNTRETGKSSGNKNYILTHKSDRVVVSCFNSGKSTIQGKQSLLLEKLLPLVIELLPSVGEVTELLNNYHELNIKQEEIEIKFNSLLPNFDKNKIRVNGQKLVNTLKQSVYNTMLKGTRPDYTDLVTPSLRASECFLLEILINKGILRRQDDNTSLGCFEKNNGVYEIQKAHKSKFLTGELDYINELYNFYHAHRHTLSHWDRNITRTIQSMDEARNLINSNLELIDRYYEIY